MSWLKFDNYGGPPRQALVDIVASCPYRGTIEVQLRGTTWECLCHELGSTRPVTLDVAEDRAALVTFVSGRRMRIYALEQMGSDDFRYRVVEK